MARERAPGGAKLYWTGGGPIRVGVSCARAPARQGDQPARSDRSSTDDGAVAFMASSSSWRARGDHPSSRPHLATRLG